MAGRMSAKKVRESLVEQLRLRGADMAANLALVDDYMHYYEMERQCRADIKKRGLSYRAISSTGKEFDKDNPAIKNELEFNKRKLAILKQLEIAPSTVAVDEEDDEL